MAVFEGKKSLNDIVFNDRMSDDEVIASYVSPQYLFTFKSLLPLKLMAIEITDA